MSKTRLPITIRLDAQLSDAIELMHRNAIRHLPVLDGDRLVGVVSDRDLGIIESLKPDELGEITIAEAMTPNPHTVVATTPVSDVARVMADNKYGCVIVTDVHGAMTGVFTTTDALRILATLGANVPVGDCV